jgi:hypothetical protein
MALPRRAKGEAVFAKLHDFQQFLRLLEEWHAGSRRRRDDLC